MNSHFGLDHIEWDELVDTVRAGECTPFLGAGASTRIFGSARELAQVLAARDADLLRPSPDNLPKIAQQLRNRIGPAGPRRRMVQFLKSKAPSGAKPPDTPHMALASLDFKAWITTAYDDLIERALVENWKNPQVRLCRWAPFSQYPNTIKVRMKDNKLKSVAEPFAESREASIAEPLVYHMYGHFDWEETLVVSEFDYFEFLASTAQHADRPDSELDVGRISSRVDAIITGTSLLFLGYRLGDLDFRILLHSIKHRLAGNLRLNIALQLQPEDAASEEIKRAVSTTGGTASPQEQDLGRQQDKLRDYAELDLKEYFRNARVKVLFADSEVFATELARACNPPPGPGQ